MSVNKIKDCFTREGFECIFDAPMDKFTTLKIGGKADVMVMPASVDELKKIISLTRENDVPVCFMGNGSNLLVSDKGIRGVVVRLGSNMASTRVSGNEIYAQSTTATDAQDAPSEVGESQEPEMEGDDQNGNTDE